MKEIIYLIQGQAKFVKNYADLFSRKDVDTIVLTYDEQFTDTIFYPNSTWGEGRNKLLLEALLRKEKYNYYIFLDDDISFQKGNFKLFEDLLLKYRPAIAVPVFSPKTLQTVCDFQKDSIETNKRTREYQICKFADAQFMAIHKDVISDNIIVPLQIHFDQISWWATSSTQQLLMFNFYKKYILQFNNIWVQNDSHREYINNNFFEIQDKWFSAQFRKKIHDPRPYSTNIFKEIFSKTSLKTKKAIDTNTLMEFMDTVFFTFVYRKKSTYKLSKKKLDKKLRPDCQLMKQFNTNKITI
jgi:hypothetical protein